MKMDDMNCNGGNMSPIMERFQVFLTEEQIVSVAME